jgi:endoglucanase
MAARGVVAPNRWSDEGAAYLVLSRKTRQAAPWTQFSRWHAACQSERTGAAHDARLGQEIMRRRQPPAFPRPQLSRVIVVLLLGSILVLVGGLAFPVSGGRGPTSGGRTVGRARPRARPTAELPTATPAPTCLKDPAHLPPPVGPSGQPLDYWHTCGTRILDRQGQPIHVGGVSWSGMELPGGAPEGLNQRNYRAILTEVKRLGYNVVRIPFSSQAIQPGNRPSNIDPKLNPSLAGLTSLEVLDRIIAECHVLGLKVILDHHRISPWSVPPLWHDSSYSTADWIADWVMLAKRYRGNDTVIGFDLQNEPYQATWGTNDPSTDWRLAATHAGDAVLQANPYLLVFVEGIGQYDRQPIYWYGGELRGVEYDPIYLNLPGRLVYSPHEYGPSVYPQQWFYAPDYPSNMPAIWNYHWGFIVQQEVAPVVIGEMGAPETGYGVGGTWQRTFLSFLSVHDIGFLTWALNPDASDTGSVFDRNWQTVNAPREALYAPYLHPDPHP